MSLRISPVNFSSSRTITFGDGENNVKENSSEQQAVQETAAQEGNEGGEQKKGLSKTTKVVGGLAALALLGVAVYYGVRGKGGAAEKAATKAGEALTEAGQRAGDTIAETGSKIGDEVAETGAKAGEAVTEAGSKAADVVDDAAKTEGAAPKAGEAADDAAKTEGAAPKAGEAAEDAVKSGTKAPVFSEKLLADCDIIANSPIQNSKSGIKKLNTTYNKLVEEVKASLGLDTEQSAVVDGFVDKLAARTRAKMDGNFAEGSTEAGVAAGMKEFFSNNPLLTPEVQAKYNLVCTFVKHKAEILKGDITGAVNYIGKLMA